MGKNLRYLSMPMHPHFSSAFTMAENITLWISENKNAIFRPGSRTPWTRCPDVWVSMRIENLCKDCCPPEKNSCHVAHRDLATHARIWISSLELTFCWVKWPVRAAPTACICPSFLPSKPPLTLPMLAWVSFLQQARDQREGLGGIRVRSTSFAFTTTPKIALSHGTVSG